MEDIKAYLQMELPFDFGVVGEVIEYKHKEQLVLVKPAGSDNTYWLKMIGGIKVMLVVNKDVPAIHIHTPEEP